MTTIADFKDSSGLWARTQLGQGKHLDETKSYVTWRNMKRRCGSTASCKKFNTYRDCTVSDDFTLFQDFANWYTEQIGYDLGYEIDKDILVPGNKVYSKKTCALVPQELNKFLVSNNAVRGKYPQGVSLFKRDNTYVVHIRRNDLVTHLGYFTSVADAALVYKRAKEVEAQRWYLRLASGEFPIDPRVIERMRTWTFEEKQC